MKLNFSESKKLISIYFSNNNSATEAARVFNTWSIGNHSPTRVNKKNVIDLIKRYERDTPFHLTTRRRTSVLNNEAVLTDVIGSIAYQPGRSIRKCATDNHLSVGTTHAIVRDVLKLKPYRMKKVQALSEYDKLVRTDACQRLLPVITEEKEILFSDEATFYLDGHVNLHNYCCWAHESPEEFFVQQRQGAPHVTVWVALSKRQIFGPYFFPSTVTADSYCAVLSQIFVPDIMDRYGSLENLWFQQDGAPAHYAEVTRYLLNEMFEGRIISRGFMNEWPPRSPDLTPLDFYLWGVVKDIVYQGRTFNDIGALGDAIVSAVGSIRQHRMADVSRAVLSVRNRMQECLSLAGSQLAHR